jgi:hypothetical protein
MRVPDPIRSFWQPEFQRQVTAPSSHRARLWNYCCLARSVLETAAHHSGDASQSRYDDPFAVMTAGSSSAVQR